MAPWLNCFFFVTVFIRLLEISTRMGLSNNSHIGSARGTISIQTPAVHHVLDSSKVDPNVKFSIPGVRTFRRFDYV